MVLGAAAKKSAKRQSQTKKERAAERKSPTTVGGGGGPVRFDTASRQRTRTNTDDNEPLSPGIAPPRMTTANRSKADLGPGGGGGGGGGRGAHTAPQLQRKTYTFYPASPEPAPRAHQSRLDTSTGRAPMRVETLDSTLEGRSETSLGSTLRHDATIRCRTNGCYAMEVFIKDNGYCIECNFVQSTEGSTYSSTVLDKFVYKPRTDDEYFEALARGGQKSETTRARHKKYDATKKMSAARWAQIKAAIMSAAAERHTRSNDGKIDAFSVLAGTAWGGPKREAAKGLPFLSDPNAVDGSMYTPHQRRVLGLETGADSVGGYQGARRDEAHERPLQLLAIAPRAQASKKNKNGGSGRLDKGKFIDMSPEGDARSR